jgi:hypothetical protein
MADTKYTNTRNFKRPFIFRPQSRPYGTAPVTETPKPVVTPVEGTEDALPRHRRGRH